MYKTQLMQSVMWLFYYDILKSHASQDDCTNVDDKPMTG